MASRDFDDLVIESCESVEELLRKQKIEDLKRCLKDRDLNLSGERHLAEKAFGGVKLGLPQAPTRTEDEENKKQTKEEKLLLEDGLIQLPSPNDLKIGWEQEVSGHN